MHKTFNNEYCVALECKDLQANAMAVDNTGSFVLLAGRRNIAIKSLNAEKDPIYKCPRQSKYDVNCAEWNPTEHRKELCAISSNQRLEVLTWHPNGDLIQTNSLRAHTRVITDINWHQFDANLVTSCSVDTFIHIWDLRDARRPSISLSAIAEATQVRWNRHSSHILATAHDGDIKIWDQRKGTSPVQYISAHLTKIHGLDWSYNSENQLATSSQDHTVKFFDTSNPRRPEYVLTTNAPVWRARYTPFGTGLITVVVPQLRRGENSLLLWNTTNRTTPMHTFIGHRDVVLEFQWRKHKTGDRDFQLVTWSKDQTLLVWKIEPFLQKLCGFEPEEVRDIDEELSDNHLNVEHQIELNKSHRKSSPRVQPLQQEFSLMNVQIPNLDVKKMDITSRTCNVHVNINSFSIYLEVSFPNTYPFGISPIFHIAPNSNVSDSIGMQLLQTLNQLAQQRVAKNRTCLEPCLRQMVTTLETLSANLKNDVNFDSTYNLEPGPVLGGYNDANIPFPRTSGAKFCSVGTLVCFGRPLMARRISTTKSEPQTGIPRALSALAKRTSDHMTVSAYYFQRQRSRVKNSTSKLAKTVVHIYDALGLFYVNKQLGEEYILDGDVVQVCRHNANVAKCTTGRWDLVQSWQLAELVAQSLQNDEESYWSNHPFGYQLLQSLISHYALQSDIQMAAMLSCIFGKIQDHFTARKSSLKSLLSLGHLIPGKKWFKSGGSPYHTIPPADVVADGWVLPTLKSTRSTSLDNLRLDSVQLAEPEPNPTSNFYEYYKLAYAETLHRWNLLYKRAEIIKYMCIPAEQHKGVEFLVECINCFKSSKNSCCNSCKKFPLNCIVCHISVRGLANCCVSCGHGGHTKHLKEWFETKNLCPTGCGCKCLIDSRGIFEP